MQRGRAYPIDRLPACRPCRPFPPTCCAATTGLDRDTRRIPPHPDSAKRSACRACGRDPAEQWRPDSQPAFAVRACPVQCQRVPGLRAQPRRRADCSLAQRDVPPLARTRDRDGAWSVLSGPQSRATAFRRRHPQLPDADSAGRDSAGPSRPLPLRRPARPRHLDRTRSARTDARRNRRTDGMRLRKADCCRTSSQCASTPTCSRCRRALRARSEVRPPAALRVPAGPIPATLVRCAGRTGARS